MMRRGLLRRGVPLLSAAGLATAATANADTPKPVGTKPAPKPVLKKAKNPDLVRVLGLSVSPPVAKPGTVVTVKLTLVNEGDAPVTNLDWVITTGATAKKGTLNLAAGQKKVVTVAFKAPKAGATKVQAALDPSKRINEPLSARVTNQVTLDVPVVAADNTWATWASAASKEAEDLIEQTASQFTCAKGGQIQSVTLSNLRLNVTTSSASPLHALNLKNHGVPEDVAKAFMETVFAAYKTWADDFVLSSFAAYPSFAAVPAPAAPPTANVPFPLVIGASPKGDAAFRASALEAAVISRLGEQAKSKDATAGIQAFAQAVSLRFEVWKVTQVVQNLMGKGPVPTFAPPYVPVGPVVMGDVISSCGILP